MEPVNECGIYAVVKVSATLDFGGVADTVCAPACCQQPAAISKVVRYLIGSLLKSISLTAKQQFYYVMSKVIKAGQTTTGGVQK